MPVVLLGIGMIACVKEEIDLSTLSEDVGLEREIAIPLFNGSLMFEDITGGTFDSLLIDGIDTIKLFLIQDIEYEDTLSLGEFGEELDLEFLNIHNSFTNMFPVGMDVRIYLYDSLISSNIDTIYFSGDPDQLFLTPATTDNNGLVIEETVNARSNVLEFNSSTLDNLMHQATDMVLVIRLPSTNSFVKILDHYTLSLELGIEAKGYYEISSGSEE
jgi:hypothetical protein